MIKKIVNNVVGRGHSISVMYWINLRMHMFKQCMANSNYLILAEKCKCNYEIYVEKQTCHYFQHTLNENLGHF